MIRVTQIDNTSPYLKEVNRLGDQNSARLGFLPHEAFLDYAKKGQIIVAVDENQTVLGYILYSITRKSIITIRHLCVSESHRGRGIAKLLIDKLRSITQAYKGIGLWCRRDWEASKVWPKLGFYSGPSRRGRGKKESELTFWWLDYDHKTLFDVALEKQLQSKLEVVIDSNIFLDLVDQERQNTEAEALRADSVSAEIELCVTNEIFNDLNRNQDAAKREEQRGHYSEFTELRYVLDDYNRELQRLSKFFPDPKTEQDESDHRHLAKALATGASIFVTRDQGLLNKSNSINQELGIRIVRPVELITKVEELRKESEYQPARFAGLLTFKTKPVRVKEIEGLKEHFQRSNLGENGPEFLAKLRSYRAQSDKHVVKLIEDTDHLPMALYALNTTNAQELDVPLFRLKRSPLAATLARYLILHFVSRAVHSQHYATRITDTYLDDSIVTALQEAHFIHDGNSWLKLNPPAIASRNELSQFLNTLDNLSERAVRHFRLVGEALKKQEDTIVLAEIEEILWPAKIADANIQTYTVPIKPYWASQLFDEKLANQTLFGVDRTELILNWEGVYYRSARPSKVSPPARILWYVTSDEDYQQVKSIRACSQMNDVIIGKPKELFKQFSRLGIYSWKDVLETANSDINKDIMALRFSHTELFETPISKSDYEQIVQEEEHKNLSLQSPFPISQSSFERIYRLGTGR